MSPASEPLVIRSLEFIGGMASAGGWRPPTELPEIAFAGRSNVGKSSLLNRLVHRKKFARVSNTPGRTREVNFFKVNDSFLLVDLPGYGYARISKERRAEWRPLIESYLKSTNQLRGVVQLLDSRHDPTPDDLQMLDYLGDIGVPTIIVLTKIDKLTAKERQRQRAQIAGAAGVDDDQTIAFSATTGEGRNELAEAIEGLLAQPSWRI
ncbi:MAG TPA: ribosome biogenesis GTP-binding protein YihA/YsxC [Gemmatimonadaceae bacterium]|jgi:GTP-binding protein|nr:ribosome biogenesis GTP-binding protein YihA/YsxC [Gemmatimonadaceae bacterium]